MKHASTVIFLIVLVSSMVVRGEEKKVPKGTDILPTYKVIGEDVTYNYSTRLNKCSGEDIHLLVWMVADQVTINPNQDISFTVYYKNLTKKTISVPSKDNLGIQVHYYSDESSGSSLSHRRVLHHRRSFSVKSGKLGSFKVVTKPFPSDDGFMQIELDWGGIVPAPITLECKPSKLK